MHYNILDKKNPEFFEDKKVIIRVGINVPIFKKKTTSGIENDFRLKAVLPTIEFLAKAKAKVVMIGHLGREKEENLDKVFEWFKKELKKKKISIIYDKKTFFKLEEKKILKKTVNKIDKLKSGHILLLDNIRATKLEEENNIELAQSIAENFSIYVNESFSVSHRKHMSIDKLPAQFFQQNRFLGFRFEEEINVIEKIKKPKGKSILILGGAKASTKIPIIEKIMDKFDLIIVGGAVANEFYKNLNYEIGKSKIDEKFTFKKDFLKKLLKSKKLFLPKKVIVERGIKKVSELSKNDKILDISPLSFLEIENKLKEAEFVFFNGPMGYYEGGYDKGTKYLLKILANKKNFFISGGGSTVSVIFDLGLEDNVDFISTGGGAFIKEISK